jgi:translation initiation factor 2 beta subunit (eIF-2beta)/eIF-5
MAEIKTFAIPKTKSDDPNYRYKREKIRIVKTSSKKSYSKMGYHWKNFGTIMEQCHIEEKHFLGKYKTFAKQPVKNENGVLSFKSLAPNKSDYEDFLESYIVLYVVCCACGLPELTSGEEITCRACGFTETVQERRARHKQKKFQI